MYNKVQTLHYLGDSCPYKQKSYNDVLVTVTQRTNTFPGNTQYQ